jgi:hypothetical protein
MPTNPVFQSGVPIGRSDEQRLLEELNIEALKIFGHDVYYIPRKLVKEDTLFGEDVLSKFDQAVPLEMYLKNTEGYGGGDFMSKFGVQINDTATFVVSRLRWDQAVARKGLGILDQRPSEGDLLYLPITSSLFEIKFVEHENPFYQLGRLYVFELSCELFVYSSEKIDTGIGEIDEIGVLHSLDEDAYTMDTETGNGFLLDGDQTGQMVFEDYDLKQIDQQSDNEVIDTESDSILDFSETNPFGEVKN